MKERDGGGGVERETDKKERRRQRAVLISPASLQRERDTDRKRDTQREELTRLLYGVWLSLSVWFLSVCLKI